MAITRSTLAENPRPKLHLLDLPQEVKDQIYAYVVSSTYLILRGSRKQRNDDFRHDSILRVSKRTNYEAMQVLQRRSWFICDTKTRPCYNSLLRKAPTQHMMNVELIVGRYCTCVDIAPAFLSFAGTDIMRRTCHVLVPTSCEVLTYYAVVDTVYFAERERFFRLMESLTGFATVVLQINLRREKNNRRDHDGPDFDFTKLPTDIEDYLGPTLGPAMPCNPVQEQKYHMTFRFSPRRFATERLASAELGV